MSTFARPMPGTLTNASVLCGRISANAVRVASGKTQYAGPYSGAARSRRQARKTW